MPGVLTFENIEAVMVAFFCVSSALRHSLSSRRQSPPSFFVSVPIIYPSSLLHFSLRLSLPPLRYPSISLVAKILAYYLLLSFASGVRLGVGGLYGKGNGGTQNMYYHPKIS